MLNTPCTRYTIVLLLLLLAGQLTGPARADSTTVTEVELHLQAEEAGHAEPAPDAGIPDPVTAMFGAPADEQPTVAMEGPALLSLQEALQRAVSDHPGIAALRREWQALDSQAWQEGRKPNPEVEIELEEFGVSGETSGISALATHLTYSQPLERGGKRSLREMAARLESGLVAWDIAELEYEVQASVRTAYAAAQAAQYELEMLDHFHELVQHIYDTVAARVEAGRSARLELERLDIELARIDLEIAAAQRSASQALQELAAACGMTQPDFSAVEASTAAELELESLAELELLLEELPLIGRFQAEYDALNALHALENANAVSDLNLFGGISRLNEINETVFKVGVAWELPIHDRNEGNINAAYHRRENIEQQRAAALLGLRTELAVLYSQAGHALQNYRAYGASLLPAANEALVLTEEGYRYGKFELLDVLDAQRTVLELESEQTAALMEYQLQLAEIEALLNADLDSWASVASESQETQIELAMAGADDYEENNNEQE